MFACCSHKVLTVTGVPPVCSTVRLMGFEDSAKGRIVVCVCRAQRGFCAVEATETAKPLTKATAQASEREKTHSRLNGGVAVESLYNA